MGQGLGPRVGLGGICLSSPSFQGSGLGFRVLGFEFRVSSFGFRVSNIGVSGLYLELGERDVERARREHLPRVRHRVGIHLDATVQNQDAITH